MRSFILAFAFSAAMICGASSQDAARVVASCGAASLTANTNSPIQMDTAGRLCGAISSSSGAPVEVVGNVANNDPDSGNPVKIGGYASTTAPTPVAAGDRVNSWFGLSGQQIVAASVGSTLTDNIGNTSGVSPISIGSTAAGGIVPTATYVYDGINWDRASGPGNGSIYSEAGPYLRGRATADTQIKATAGFVHTLSISPITATPTAGLLTVYDSASESGFVLYSEWIFATTTGHTITLDMPAGTGIYVGFDATLANVQVSASYR